MKVCRKTISDLSQLLSTAKKALNEISISLERQEHIAASLYGARKRIEKASKEISEVFNDN